MITSATNLAKEDTRSWTFLQAEGGVCSINTPREDAQDHDFFILLAGTLYVIINSQKDRGKTLKEYILKDIVPRGFDAGIEKIQEKHRQAIGENDAAIELHNDELQNREYKTRHCKHKEMYIRPS